jgi:hypothetical protein
LNTLFHSYRPNETATSGRATAARSDAVERSAAWAGSARHTASSSAASLELAPAAARARIIATDRLRSAYRGGSSLHEGLEVSRVLRLVRLNTYDYLPPVAFSDRHDLVRALHRLHAKDPWPLRRPQLCHVILFVHARPGAAELLSRSVCRSPELDFDNIDRFVL